MRKLKKKKEKIGIVISNKMKKTIIISETKRIKHPYYKKVILKKKKYYVHDEHNISNEGDLVKIIETRPLSKQKFWRLLKIVKKK
ncbi:30S ribosomal protein S17 [Candidatus Sulcia muelleri]|uniref:Small ribosomal subunit protein uS17 n=2 Tax=Candidatus Karelsulcia muelleri TaxID=336810 RepID=RS17_KARMG|nr:30S ribosomal protein S17 [Candidatus Karelsulcia muelleri]A8Z676.1 RecName: Full=Small ribosomal subunit protein uS17; AltName: Full=30S ribosomal protein S17 [Candidatus Karelsulcia muelleri GWSS]ADE35505.1 SSU ribosomal protein S17P [Candidatus Karelsulcia muelleri DMIN]EAT14148.1 Ribosomal protein S17 [Candidatus Karelsulcia muelleri str. Hc (Homalodisca coagulata)]ABS30627.1 30S ribosomal subunit protein S17 [Candidatus Karelsulcia muelleri GWSS]MBU6942346.1 30S ribosomal protein S17 [